MARRLLSFVVALVLLSLSVPSALAQSATPDASAYPDVVYTSSEYKFEGPAQIQGGWVRVTLENSGKMDHHAMFLRLNDGKTPADLMAAAKTGIPGLLSVSTSVGGPGSIAGGQKSTVIMNLEPGMYVVVCVIPDADGVPHMAKGMALPVEVTKQGAGAATEPVADASIDLADFKFENLPADVTVGRHIWKVTDVGKQLHELGIFKLAAGVTPDQFMAIMAAPPPAADASPTAEMASPAAAGGPPFFEFAGAAPMNPGQVNWVDATFEPGDYVAICFVPDSATGKPHFTLGMIMPFTVK